MIPRAELDSEQEALGSVEAPRGTCTLLGDRGWGVGTRGAVSLVKKGTRRIPGRGRTSGKDLKTGCLRGPL